MADWTSRLEPILRAQELAPEYNIHTYSDLVLTQVSSVPTMDLERRFLVLGLNIDENTGGAEEIRLTACRDIVQTDRTVVDFQEIVGYKSQHKILEKVKGQREELEHDSDLLGSGSGSESGTGSGSGVGGSSAEVCRVFLACLMLANSGNLDLIHPLSTVENKTVNSISHNEKSKGKDKDKDKDESFGSAKKEKNRFNSNQKMSFQVRLLNGKRNLDVEEFRAPSVDSRC